MDSDTIQTMLDILVSALAPGLMLYLTNLARKRLAQIQKESWYSTVELVAGNVVLAAEQLDKANLLKDIANDKLEYALKEAERALLGHGIELDLHVPASYLRAAIEAAVNTQTMGPMIEFTSKE